MTACAGEAEKADTPNATMPASIQVGQENVVRVKRDTIVTGPMISGDLRPQREATVRAELGGSMLQVNAEEGQAVRRGGTPWVLRAAGSKTEKVDVTIGLADPHTERTQIVAGVNEGDILLRGAAQGITPGTPVTVGGSR